MKIKIKTKWGQMMIDPGEVYEVNAQVNPWDNMYRLEFVMEGRRDRLYADLANFMDIAVLMKKIAVEMDFIRQYKYKDSSGNMQINEPRRLSALRSRGTEEA